MPTQLCKGGCNTELPASNKSGYAWGHKNGCPPPTPSTSEANLAPDVDQEQQAQDEPHTTLALNSDQIDRIWQALPLEEKAIGIVYALAAQR